MSVSKRAKVKKCVVGQTRSNKNLYYDGRTRYTDLFARVEDIGNTYTVKKLVIITRDSYDGPMVLCMDLVDWGQFSLLFDEHVLEMVGDSLANL